MNIREQKFIKQIIFLFFLSVQINCADRSSSQDLMFIPKNFAYLPEDMLNKIAMEYFIVVIYR